MRQVKTEAAERSDRFIDRRANFMKTIGVAILGLGVVGSGTYKILTEHREFYKRTQNVDISVESVLEINRQRALDLGVEESKISDNIAEVVSNPNVDIVVEVIGGVEPARSFVLAALHSGKTVVTSNKELFCKYWHELEKRRSARTRDCILKRAVSAGFRSSVRWSTECRRTYCMN